MPYDKTSKEEIIHVAGRLFKSMGYHRTSVRAIATEYGIFKGRIFHYHYIENKMARILSELKSQ